MKLSAQLLVAAVAVAIAGPQLIQASPLHFPDPSAVSNGFIGAAVKVRSFWGGLKAGYKQAREKKKLGKTGVPDGGAPVRKGFFGAHFNSLKVTVEQHGPALKAQVKKMPQTYGKNLNSVRPPKYKFSGL